MYWVPVCTGCQCVLGASVYWVPVCTGCQCVLGASVYWVPVCTGCQCVLGASVYWVPVCTGCQCVLGASVYWVPCVLGASVYWVPVWSQPHRPIIMLLLHYVPYSSKFSRSINFVIFFFVRCKLITKISSTKIFSPMGVSIGAARITKSVVCKKLCRLNHESFRPRKFGAIRYAKICLIILICLNLCWHNPLITKILNLRK